MYTTLIEPTRLEELVGTQAVAVIDCRFRLDDAELGQDLYTHSHIPLARYAHLNLDLSSPVIPGKTGRHPLPSPEMFGRTLSNWGISNDQQVVVYDDAGGAMAARCWWMLKWVGHVAVALLNGGWQAWLNGGHPVTSEQRSLERTDYRIAPNQDMVATADDIRSTLESPESRLIIDVRANERYLGIVEPIDTRAGHIPGAVNLPYSESLDGQTRFLSPEILNQKFSVHSAPAIPAITYCGSGVTAAHTILAHAYAGLPLPRLYAGSWSEWITDPDRPIDSGAKT